MCNVQQFVQMWKYGSLTWEQAMMATVFHLSEENHKLLDQCVRMMENQPTPPVIIKRLPV